MDAMKTAMVAKTIALNIKYLQFSLPTESATFTRFGGTQYGFSIEQTMA